MADQKPAPAPPPPPSRQTLERQTQILREIGASQKTIAIAEKVAKSA